MFINNDNRVTYFQVATIMIVTWVSTEFISSYTKEKGVHLSRATPGQNQ